MYKKYKIKINKRESTERFVLKIMRNPGSFQKIMPNLRTSHLVQVRVMKSYTNSRMECFIKTPAQRLTLYLFFFSFLLLFISSFFFILYTIGGQKEDAIVVLQ